MRMNVLDIAIGLFIVLEMANVLILYFFPDLKQGNGIGVFNDWHRVKDDEPLYLFVKYLVNWVANAKVIFIALLMVILVFGDNPLKLASTIVIILSVSMYYWRLYPIMVRLDKLNLINPRGYSRKLLSMIVMIQVVILIAIIIYISFI